MPRSLRLCFSLLAVLLLLVITAGTTSASQSGAHYLKVKGAHGGKPSRGSLLSYRGGAIESAPRVFIIWWGPDWKTGFSTGAYTSAKAQNYVQSFFGNVGGSTWSATDTQYCQGVANGSASYPATATHAGNPSSELGGIWNDTSALPSSITQSAIAAEAVAATAVFGYSAQADYMIFTPSGHSQSGFATSWCAYHGSTSSSGGSISYSYMPFQPDAGASCGMNFVNSTDNAFGNGYFDGFSIVGGHEYAETVTDPFPSSGWVDSRGSEIGDKCAWISSPNQGASRNITLGANDYAVQSLWSNAFNSGAGGCVTQYP